MLFCVEVVHGEDLRQVSMDELELEERSDDDVLEPPEPGRPSPAHGGVEFCAPLDLLCVADPAIAVLSQLG